MSCQKLVELHFAVLLLITSIVVDVQFCRRQWLTTIELKIKLSVMRLVVKQIKCIRLNIIMKLSRDPNSFIRVNIQKRFTIRGDYHSV